MISGIDHVQLAMPPGGEDAARAFYGELLGLRETLKPDALRARGGAWFEGARTIVHLGVDAAFAPARKAHPAFLVTDLDALQQRLRDAGCEITDDASVPGVRRIYASDPFGNRLEFIADGDGFSQRR